VIKGHLLCCAKISVAVGEIVDHHQRSLKKVFGDAMFLVHWTTFTYSARRVRFPSCRERAPYVADAFIGGSWR